MSAIVRVLLFAVVVAAFAGAAPGASADVTGVWLTEKGDAKIKIAPCGDQLCGHIVWMLKPLDDEGKEKLDKNNPDEALRARPILGLKLLNGFVRDAGAWTGGHIYSPRDGKSYNANMVLDGPDKLRLRGYVGLPLLGRTEVWTRAE